VKKILYFFLGLVGVLVVVFFLSTGKVKDEPFLESTYFKKTIARVDSLKRSVLTVADTLYAGFSRVSITPTIHSLSDDAANGKFVTVPLAGFGARKGKPATGVHDSLFVKAVALKVGQKLMVFVGADLLIMPPNITDSVVSRLAASGITRDQLLFSATHTHSSVGAWGPGFIGEAFGGKANPAIQQWLVNCLVKSVELAVGDLSRSTLTSGSFDAAGLTRNRFIGDLGTKNPDFSYILVNQTGKRRAVIGTFSAHSTTLGDKNMDFSADYPGYWERKMEADSFDVALFSAGALGSQSPSGKGKAFESSKYIGESLADSLMVRLPSATYQETTPFASATLRVSMPEYHLRLTTRINMATWLSNKLMPEPRNVYFQAVRIGKIIWISAPSDFSGELALEIKNRLAANGYDAVVSSFNGSYVGYIVPSGYFYMDEYESKLMGWFGPTMGDYSMYLIRQLTDIVGK